MGTFANNPEPKCSQWKSWHTQCSDPLFDWLTMNWGLTHWGDWKMEITEAGAMHKLSNMFGLARQGTYVYSYNQTPKRLSKDTIHKIIQQTCLNPCTNWAICLDWPRGFALCNCDTWVMSKDMIHKMTQKTHLELCTNWAICSDWPRQSTLYI